MQIMGSGSLILQRPFMAEFVSWKGRLGVVDVLWIVAQIVLLILAADFMGGLFHWAEDSYGTENTPFWGPVFVGPNIRHHRHPSAMMRKHWLPNNAPLFGVSTAIVLVALAFDALSWQILVFAVFSGLNQQVHRFNHTPSVRLPGFVRVLQRLHFMQDARHHWCHHRPPHRTHFCALTPYMNPVLDRIGFWRGLERLVRPILGPVRSEA